MISLADAPSSASLVANVCRNACRFAEPLIRYRDVLAVSTVMVG